MSVLGIIGDVAEKIIGSAKGILDEVITTEDERNLAQIELQKVIQENMAELEKTQRAELEAKQKIIVAEMQQGDNYTKRARPTVVYVGLAMIAVNYVLMPILGRPAIPLPAEFWMAWGGVVSVWSIGRSAEKVGVKNKAVKTITGSFL